MPILFILFFFLFCTDDIQAEKERNTASNTQNENPGLTKGDLLKMSEAFGHLIGKNLGDMNIAVDTEAFIKGLREAKEGKSCPMSEKEFEMAMTNAQKTAFDELCQKNLNLAESFLKENKSNPQVISIENGKVQYRILKEGKGDTVKPKGAPLVRYTGKYLDGNSFGSSKNDEVLFLEETIPGLRAALIGMKEGEKRVVYIHPDLGYGTHVYLAPNSLLTFEIEVIQATTQESKTKSLLRHIPFDEPSGQPLEAQTSLR